MDVGLNIISDKRTEFKKFMIFIFKNFISLFFT